MKNMLDTPMNRAILRAHGFLGNLVVSAAVAEDVKLLLKQAEDLNELEKDLFEKYAVGQMVDWQSKPLELNTEESIQSMVAAGAIQLKLGEPKKAKLYYDRARRTDPSYPMALVGLAKALAGSGYGCSKRRMATSSRPRRWRSATRS